MITTETLDFLTSSRGIDLLGDLASADLSDTQILPILTRLRKTYTGEQAGAAVEMARLRQKAFDKFGDDAQVMLFIDSALQQASDPLVRGYRAERMGSATIADLCCGIGADSLAFARAGADVLGVDIDEVRIRIAAHNADVLGITNADFTLMDVREFSSDHDVIFFDPARRDESGRRLFDVEAYIPPLSLIRLWNNSRIVVKLAPGVDLTQLESYGGTLEFVSVAGDLKEAVLWVDAGPLRTRATILQHDVHHHWDVQEPMMSIEVSPPLAWLLEPDAAMIRASGIRELAQTHSAHLLDESIAYLTTRAKVDSAWVRSWQILDWMPFNLKKLRAYLRARDVGRVTVKKRGSPLTPELLIRKLKLKGDQSRTLVLTQYQREPIVMICADYTV